MLLTPDDEDFEWEPPTEAEMKVIQARRERQDKISKLMGDYLLKGYKMLGECCDACGVSGCVGDGCRALNNGEKVECWNKCVLCFQTILLQDKQQKNYCVSCQELDSDVDKDNPGTHNSHTHIYCSWEINTPTVSSLSSSVPPAHILLFFFPSFLHHCSCLELLVNFICACSHVSLSSFSPPLSALNAQAALSQVRERQLAAQSPAPSQAPELNGGPISSQASVSVPRPEHCEGAAAGGRAALPPPAVPSPSTPAATTALAPTRPPVSPQSAALQTVLQEAEEAVLTKLRWATTQLQCSASLEASIQLCSLITSCASSLRSLKELSQ